MEIFFDGIGNAAGYGIILIIVAFSENYWDQEAFGFQIVPEDLYMDGL